MDIVISFDDTGSMYAVRSQVRQKVESLVKQLFKLDNKTRIGMIIHNDYCDSDTIQHLDLTDDEGKIIKFINRKSSNGGGDSDECYELVLNYFYSNFSWQSDKRIAILIGDCEPHEVGYKYGKWYNKLDWKVEAKNALTAGIKTYAVQALGGWGRKNFYNELAKINNTPKLELSQFSHIIQFITAIMYNEVGKLEEYENSDDSFKTNYALKKMFARLKGLVVEEDSRSAKLTTSSYGEGDESKTIDLASRFQILDVGTSHRVIKEFVEDNGATFKKGRGFYQFILTETIQENKEVLFVDKKTGEVKSDTVWCRNQLGVPLGSRGRVNPKTLECSKQYDIFIQSTSYNRKLDPNTKFLYELEHK